MRKRKDGQPDKRTKEYKEAYNALYGRIEHIDRIRTCYIMRKDIPVATLTHEYSSLSGEFDWVIAPIWENWDLYYKKYGDVVDIAGIDDVHRKKEYIRRFNPSFVTQRTIPEGREDLFPLLEQIGLSENDLFEVLCRTHGVCGNDDLYVSRTPDKVIDYYTWRGQYDIPDFDTSRYGWL